MGLIISDKNVGKRSINLKPDIALVRREVETVIDMAGLSSLLLEGVIWQLAQKGKVLYTGEGVCWSILPLLVCESLCGDGRCAASGAAALEFFFAAGDVFDDIEDHEPEDSLAVIYGEEKALNIAVTMLMLSQRAVIRLDNQGVKSDIIVSIMEAMSHGGLCACVGQHRDLSYESENDISTDTYLEMVASKSASLLEAACRVGAIIATDDSRIIDSYGLFGHHFGMAAQIINDAQSIITGNWRSSDITRKKKTLPVIFAFSKSDEIHRQLLEHVYHPETIVTPELYQQAAKAIIASGALFYSSVVAEKNKQLAVKSIKANVATDSRLLTLLTG